LDPRWIDDFTGLPVLALLELTTLWLLLQLTTSFDFEGLPVLVLLDLTTPRLPLLPLKSFALGDLQTP
jgi:hypothetical protein